MTGIDDRATAADLVAARVATVPGVAGLNGGVLGGVATYLPGRTVRGVRIRPEGTSVELTVYYGLPLAEIADAARAAVLAVPGVVPPVAVSISQVVEAPEITRRDTTRPATTRPDTTRPDVAVLDSLEIT